MRPQITVGMDSDTGPVFHGASGALYGLSEDGVPGADLLAPLRIKTIAQKPPGGLQHPGGDADRAAPGFFAAGGELIFVLMQDIYPDWPYRDCGIDDYLATIKSMAASADRRFAFIPFNEPDWIWYDLKTADADSYHANRDRFLADWTAACQAIRSAGALVVGPNEAYFDTRFMPEFLAYAKANNVLPDIISWHELSPVSLQTYRMNYASFRAIERRLGISPLPVAVNEYGNRRDLSCPGQLVQWIAMFEETKVYADLAYWDIAGNYSDNAVQHTIPNGSWWLLRWYGAMTGHTVRVTPPAPGGIDTLSGLASVDPAKRQARVIVADPAGGAARIALTGIDPGVFGERVRVLVQAASRTGYAAAGGTDVGPIGQPGSGVEFRVTAAQAGRYLLRVYYGNQTEDIARLGMRIDDQPWSLVSYPPTLNGGFRSHRDVFARLGAGAHVIAFGAGDPATGTLDGVEEVEGVKGEVTLNALELAYAPTSVPGVTHSGTHYPAAYADLSGGAVIGYPPGAGPAGSVTAPGGSRVGFVVQADRDGYHRVSAAGSGGDVRLLVGGTEPGTGTTRAFKKDILVYLHAGITRIDWLPAGRTVVIDSRRGTCCRARPRWRRTRTRTAVGTSAGSATAPIAR